MIVNYQTSSALALNIYLFVMTNAFFVDTFFIADFLKFTKLVGASDEMDITTLNIRRLMNTIVPASDLEDLYTQGYEHTKKFIQDKELVSKHYYESD